MNILCGILNSNLAIWQTSSLYTNRNPGLVFSVFCVLMSFCDTANGLFYVVQILSISYFFVKSSEPMDSSHFKIHMTFPSSLLPEIHLVLK